MDKNLLRKMLSVMMAVFLMGSAVNPAVFAEGEDPVSDTGGEIPPSEGNEEPSEKDVPEVIEGAPSEEVKETPVPEEENQEPEEEKKEEPSVDEEEGSAVLSFEEDVPFEDSVSMDGLTVSVSAEAGAFPEGSFLSVQKVENTEVSEAIDKERSDSLNAAITSVFDVQILSDENTPIEPAEDKKATIRIQSDVIADENLSSSIYHIQEEDGELTAKALEVTEEGDTASAETDSFSYYALELTYPKMEYDLAGQEMVSLAEILNTVGLKGEVSSTSSEQPELFTVENTDGTWQVVSHDAFSDPVSMNVTIRDIPYRIEMVNEGSTAMAGAEQYPLWIGGEQFTSEKLSIAGGDGTATFDPDTYTLTLNNYSYKGKGTFDSGRSVWGALYYSGKDDLTIQLTGTNKLEQTGVDEEGHKSAGINIDFRLEIPNITVAGNGTLEAIGADTLKNNQSSYGIIFLGGKLTIDSGTVIARSGNAKKDSIALDAGTPSSDPVLIINGGTLRATSGNAGDRSFGMGCGKTSDGPVIRINGGTVVAEAGDSGRVSYGIDVEGFLFTEIGEGITSVSASGKTSGIYGKVKNAVEGRGWKTEDKSGDANSISISNKEQELDNYKVVEFKKIVSYPLWIGGEQFTSEKLSIAGGDGTATYNPDTNTLTLNNYSYTGVGYAFSSLNSAFIYKGNNSEDNNLTITLIGNNHLEQAGNTEESCGIYVYHTDLTIEGSGTLEAKSGTANGSESYGIYVLYGNLTINSGTVSAIADQSERKSAGIYVTGSDSGRLTITGGTVTAVSSNGKDLNYGIQVSSLADPEISMTGGSLTAVSTGDSRYCYGIAADCIEIGEDIISLDISVNMYASCTNATVKNAVAGRGWDHHGTSPSIPVNTSGQTLIPYSKVEFPERERYPLWIGGEQFTSLNASSGIKGDTGTATYNPDTNTLTLDNYTYSGKGTAYSDEYRSFDAALCYTGDSDLTIDFTGTNTLKQSGVSQQKHYSAGILLYNENSSPNVSIGGSGTLSVTGANTTDTTQGSYGIYSKNDTIAVTSGTVNVTAGNTNSDSCGIYSSVSSSKPALSIDDGTLNVSSGDTDNISSYGVYAYNSGSGSGVGITKGNVTVSAGKSPQDSIGINGHTEIGEGVAFVAVTGETAAINGKVKNAVKGRGWKTADKSTDAEVISISNTARELNDYKVLEFPYTESYPLWIGGERFTDEKLSIAGGDGTATFNPDTHTLTLNNYSYTGKGHHNGSNNAALYYSGDDELTIAFEGTNHLEQTGTSVNEERSLGIYSKNADLVISGDGTLNAIAGPATGEDGSSYGIWCAKNGLTITEGTINASAGQAQKNSYGIFSQNSDTQGIRITGGTVTASGSDSEGYSYGMYGYEANNSDVLISGGSVIATGGNGAKGSDGIKGTKTVSIRKGITLVKAQGKSKGISGTVRNAISGTGWKGDEHFDIAVSNAGQNISEYSEVQFPSIQFYPLWVGGTQVTNANMNDIPAASGETKTGTASYDPDSNTLTLNNYSYAGKGTYISEFKRWAAIYYESGTDDPLTIQFEGSSHVEQTGISAADYMSCGIYIYSGQNSADLILDGTGTLDVISADATGKGQYSYGIIGQGGGVTIQSGTINIVSGEADKQSYAIYGQKNTDAPGISITGGTVTATARGAGDFCEGLMGYCSRGNVYVSITGGTVIASAGASKSGISYGISGAAYIGAAVEYVSTTGETYGFYGKVKNELAGTGWKNGTAYAIAVNTEGKDLSEYTKVQFPEIKTYPLWIGGMQVTNANMYDIPAAAGETKTGTATYNPDTHTLTLNNYSYKGKGTFDSTYSSWGALYYNGEDNLAIQITGSNRLEQSGVDQEDHNSAGLLINGGDQDPNITITGSGTLEAIGADTSEKARPSHGISCAGRLTIDSGTVIARSGNTVSDSVAISIITISSDPALTINGGTLNVISGNAGDTCHSYGINSFNLRNGPAIKINGGTVTAKASETAGDSCGIVVQSGFVEIGTGITSVSASGMIGPVKNEVAGTGWKDDTAYTIAVNTAGQDLSEYTEVKFPAHVHAFTYTASGNVITATCTAADCPLPEHKATLTISAPDHTTYGDGKAPEAKITDENSIQGSAEVQYYKAKDDGTADGSALSGAPTSAGSYRAEITVGSVTAFVVYSIAPKAVTATVTAIGREYQAGNVSVSLNPGTISGIESGDIVTEDLTGASGTMEDDTAGENKPVTVSGVKLAGRDAENYTLSNQPTGVTVTIGKAAAYSILTPPTPNSTYYSGTETELLSSAAESNGGTVVYAIGTKDSAPAKDDQKWSTSFPKGTDTGIYYVWCMARGDVNHYDSEAVRTVSKIVYTVTFKVDKGEWDAGGSEDQILPLSRYADEDLALKLEKEDFPTVGDKPAEGYQKGYDEGLWKEITSEGPKDVKIPPDYTITSEKTYQYTYAAKEPAEVTEKPAALNLTYTGSSQALVTAGTASGGVLWYALGEDKETAPTDGWSKSLPESINAGTYYVWYKVIGDVNHTDSDPDVVEAKIVKAQNPMTYAATQSVSATYSTSSQTLTLTPAANAEGTVSYEITSQPAGDYFSLAETALTVKANTPANTYTVVVKATAAGNGNYNSCTIPSTVTVTVEKADNPATVADSASVMRGSQTIDLKDNVTLNGATGAVSYAFADDDTKGCSLNGSVLTSGNTAGTVIINVTVAADTNYKALAATPITVTITDKQTQTISADDVSATYGETGKSVSATVTDPVSGGGDITYAVKTGSENYIDVDKFSGALTIKKTGYATVVVTAAETVSYAQATKEVTVTISRADPIANAPAGLSAVYGETLADVSLENKNPEGNTPGTWAWVNSSATVGDAGQQTFKANFTPTDSTNYNSRNNVDVTVNVDKKAVIVSGITGKNKIYDGNVNATVDTSAVILDGKLDGDALSVTATGTFSDKNAGPDKTITLSSLRLTGTDAGNYELAGSGQQETCTANIDEKEVSVSGITGKNKTYNGNTEAEVDTSFAVIRGKVDGDELSVTATGTFSDKNVGAGKTITLNNLSLTGTDAGNYTLTKTTQQSTCTANIEAKAVTVSGVTGKNKIYDGTVTAEVDTSNAVLDGKVDGDDLSVTAAGTFSDKNAGTGKTITLSNLSLTGTDAGNYTLTKTTQQSSCTATIEAKAVTVSGITGTNKTYDGNVTAVVDTSNAVLDGKVDGDDLSVTANGAFSDKNAGTGKTITLSDLSLTGTDAGNYTLTKTTQQSTCTADIEEKAITVSGITGKNKTYDGDTDAEVDTSAAVLNGKVDGDDLSVTATGTFSDKNVGAGKTITLNNLSLTGTDAGNYTLTKTTQQSTCTANIEAKAVTVSGITGTNKTYDGNVTAVVDTSNAVLDGKFDGDDLSVTANGAFSDKNAGTGKTITLSDLSLTGTDAGNYTLTKTTQQSTCTADIEEKAITVSGITGKNKTYDGTVTAEVDTNNAVLDGKVEGDDLSVTATGTFSDKNAGAGKTITLSDLSLTGTDAGNYTLTKTTQQSSCTANIEAKAVTVSGITGTNKTYDGNTTAEVITSNAVFDGLVSGDTLSVTATGTFSDKNAGAGKTITLSDLTLTGTDAGNYILAESGQQETCTANIDQKEVTLVWNDTDLEYNEQPQQPTATATGLIYGDECTVTVTVEGDHTDAGTYTATASSLSNSNYKLPANNTTSFTIEKEHRDDPEDEPQNLTASKASSKTSRDAVISGVDDTMEYSIDGGVTYTPCTGDTIENLGPGVVLVRYAEDKNHEPSIPAEITIVRVDKTYWVEQDNKSWTKGSSKSLTVTFKGSPDDDETYGCFQNLYVDDVLVERIDESYETTSGSVNIILKPKYLKTLKKGSHTLKAVFEDGEATATIKIKEESGGSSSSSDDTTAGSGGVITCQMAGYPNDYAWNEAAKACQPGYLDNNGVFHAYASNRSGVPNTYDEGLGKSIASLLVSTVIAVISGTVLRKNR